MCVTACVYVCGCVCLSVTVCVYVCVCVLTGARSVWAVRLSSEVSRATGARGGAGHHGVAEPWTGRAQATWSGLELPQGAGWKGEGAGGDGERGLVWSQTPPTSAASEHVIPDWEIRKPKTTRRKKKTPNRTGALINHCQDT